MALDLTKMSDADLEHLANNDYAKMSDAGLRILSTSEKKQIETEGYVPQFYPTGPGVSTLNVPGVQTAKTILGPAASAVGSLAKEYVATPAKALADVTLGSTIGVPPVAGKTLYPGVAETYQRAMDYVNKAGQFAPGGQPAVAPAATTDELAQAAKTAAQMTPDELAAYMKGAPLPAGAAPATAPAAAPAQGGFIERMADLARRYGGATARVAGPVLNTAGRIAGPVGMAYNAAQAGEFAREAELGPRLASGQGGMAQQAFRQQNQVYGQDLSADQARAVLESGSERDIAAFGGRQRLMALAGM